MHQRNERKPGRFPLIAVSQATRLLTFPGVGIYEFVSPYSAWRLN
jgi:hypothetical protein